MSRKIKAYTTEFREEAIKLALSSEVPVSQVAKGLGMPAGTLHTWLCQAKLSGIEQVKASSNGNELVNVSEVLAENKTLKRRLARLEQEQAILKRDCCDLTTSSFSRRRESSYFKPNCFK